MNFSWFLSYKIAWSKTSTKHLSGHIVRIGQVAVAIGVIVALVTLSTGVGARKEIKQKLADFNGHFTIRPYNSNLSLNSDSITLPQDYYPHFPDDEIEHIQAIATKSGIIRSPESFEGILFKGVDKNFDAERFQKFIKKGSVPHYSGDSISREVMISQTLADKFFLDIDSTFQTIFVNEKQRNPQPIYRTFKVKGIYSTDIQAFDDLYLIGDLQQVQRINGWGKNQVGGFELFTGNVESDFEPIKERINEIISYNLLAESATDHFPEINDWIQIFDTNISLILSIMLVVVVINMIMILLILILERTHTIGVLKTLGAGNFQIQMIFVYYALFIMLPGLLVGNIIALALLLTQQQWGIIQLPPENYFISQAPVYFSWQMIAAVNIGCLLICGLILLLPSYLVRRISPVKALKI